MSHFDAAPSFFISCVSFSGCLPGRFATGIGISLLLQFDDFFYLSLEVGSEYPFAYIFFNLLHAPEASAVQFVTGVQFTVVNSFVNKDKFFLTIRFEYIAG